MSKVWLTELPEWIDPEVWEQYQIHRKAIKKNMTNYAEYLCVKQLNTAGQMAHGR